MDLLNMTQKEVNQLLKGEIVKPFPANEKELLKALSVVKPYRTKCIDPSKVAEVVGYSVDHIQYFYEKLNDLQGKDVEKYNSL